MMENKRYYKSTEIKQRFNLTLFIIVGLELAFSFAVNYIIGGILILITFGILAIKSGIEIDVDNDRMRNYLNFMGIELSSWTNIPKLKYISIVRIKLKRKTFKASALMFDQTSSDTLKYNVNLITEDKRKRFIKILTAGKEESIMNALNIGELLNLKVLDYTTSEKEWIR